MEELTLEQAQDKEYYRYLTRVVSELKRDPVFKEKLDNATEQDIRSGKIAEEIRHVRVSIR